MEIQISKTVICLSSARSGTNFLRSWFDQNPAYETFGELFSKSHNFAIKLNENGIKNNDGSSISVRELLQLEENIEAMGQTLFFKIFYDHLDKIPETDQLSIFNNRKIIHLIRTNPLETFFSSKKAKSENIWKTSDQNKIKFTRYKLDREEFNNWFDKKSNQIKHYSKLIENNTKVRLEYQSNYFENYLNKELNSFLKDDFNLNAKLKKQNPYQMCDVIINYDSFEDMDHDLF